MELLKIERVKVGEKEYPIAMTNRAIISIEKDGKEFDSSVERLLKMFYFTAHAGAKKTGEDFPDSFEDFMDLIDDHYEDIISNFPKALEAISYKKKEEELQNPE